MQSAFPSDPSSMASWSALPSAPSQPDTPPRRFDDRLQTRLSLLRDSRPRLSIASKSSVSSTASSSFVGQDYSGTVTWPRMKVISDYIYSRKFRISYGSPECLSVSDTYIAIGTSKGYMFVYNDRQKLVHQLGHHASADHGSVSCLAFSLDSTYLAAGYSSGYIDLWNFAKPDAPVLEIEPSNKESLPIIQLGFVGLRHTGFISVDESGQMVSHSGSRNFVGMLRSTDQVLMGNSGKDSRVILDFSLLPPGSTPQETDTLGVVAIITPDALAIVSTLPSLRTHFKIARPKSLVSSQGLTASVAWFPAISNKAKTQSSPAVLAYCWCNVLTLFEVCSETVTDSTGNNSVIIRFESRKRWVSSEPVVNISWLSSKILVALTTSQRLVFLGRDEFRSMAAVDMIARHMKSTTLFKGNSQGVLTRVYSNTFKVLKSSVFVLGKSHFYVGTLSGWADVLFSSLKDGHYIEALEYAKRQYEGVDCNLDLLGLPRSGEERHRLMHSYIVRLLDASSNYLFERESTLDPETLSSFLAAALRTCCVIDSDQEAYNTLYERCSDFGYEDTFFEALEPLLAEGEITILPAEVLRRLVEYYISKGRSQILEELLCKLDISHLDIDLSIRLCKQHHLVDTLVYIWNTLLHDYVTPIFDAIKAFEAGKTDSEFIFTYLSYILTGRRYPTDRLILPDSDATIAKLNIYYALFNGAAIGYPAGAPKFHIAHQEGYEEPSFPYLCILLQHSSLGVLSSLNEAFEDALLNDDEVVTSENKSELKVNRQYIVDVIVGIFRQDTAGVFTDADRTYLAIFIARNYPKYPQFIRLSDSVLDEIIQDLCNFPDESLKEECELSLQSLLSIYKPADYDSLMMLFERCGFHNALLSIYRTENKYLQILDLWLKDAEPNADSQSSFQDMNYQLFQSVPAMTRECLTKTDPSSVSRLQVEDFIRAHFAVFVKSYSEEMAELFSLECPSLNSAVLELEDTDPAKYRYLHQLVEMELSGQLPYTLSGGFNLAYAKVLAEQRPEQLEEFVLNMSGKDVAELTAFLESHQEYEIIARMRERQGDYKDAVTTALHALEVLGHEMMETSGSDTQAERMIDLLDLCFRLLRDITGSTVGKDGLTQEERLLLQLIETSVRLFGGVSSEQPETAKPFKRLMQHAFTGAMAEKQNCSDSFLRVFYKFLDQSRTVATTLGDVRPVINEVFLSYSHDEVILGIILKLLNDDIYSDLVDLEQLRLQGWSPVRLECEVCGKKIWGPNINPNNYEVWQDHKLGVEEDEALEKALEIRVFQCRHSYHTKCLENMGMSGKNSHCILCNK